VNPKDFFEKIIEKYNLSLILGLVGLCLVLAGLVLPKINNHRAEVTVESGSNEDVSESEITVDVSGAVNQPGVYSFKNDSRVKEAIEVAKGFSSDVDLLWVEKNLNLAAKLTDAQKIYIPRQGEKASSQGSSELININTATAPQLDTLPGVGEVTAGKIIDGRPYSSIEELKTKKVVGNATYEKIKDLISAN